VKPATRRRRWRLITDETGVLVTLLVLVAVIGAFHPTFLQFQSIVSLLRDTTFVGLMACGMVYLLSMQEIDLSVGSIYGLSALICAMLIRGGVDPWIAAGVTLVPAGGMGVLNALVANVFKLPAIIVTLGTLSVYRGVGLLLSNGAPITGLSHKSSFFSLLGGDVLGVPASVWILVIAGAFLHVGYRRTRFGTLVRAVGSNRRAAEFAGIPVDRVRLQALTLTALLCGLAGVLTVAFFGIADPSLGTGQEIVVIAAAIIGGTSLSGGSGTVIGALLGASLITVINAGLVYFGVNANWGTLVTGLVIIAAVSLDSSLRRRLFSHILRPRPPHR
jgi:ribose transport system permease protein